jgi:hypothetical protein
MPTPNFKLLANSLRLGQPPEPMAAFRVLVEVIQQQQAELLELRSRVGMLTSRLQFAEAKLERMGSPAVGEVEEPRTEDSLRDLGSTMSVPMADVDAIAAQAAAMPFRPAPELSFSSEMAPPLPATPGHLITDDPSYDDSLMTSIMKRKGRDDDG